MRSFVRSSGRFQWVRSVFHLAGGLLILLGLLSVGGCGRFLGPRDHEAAVRTLTFEVLKGGLPKTREGIVRRLGPPERSDRKSVENRHVEDRQDTVHRLVYPGLKIWIYHASYNDRQFLTRVELGPDGPSPAGPLRFGQSPRKVRSLLGKPLERSEDRLGYGQPPNRVSLNFRRGRLRRVTWDFYVD